MKMVAQYLISKDTGKLQLPYAEYISLMEKAKEARRIQQVKDDVLADLQRYLEGKLSEKASYRKAVTKPVRDTSPSSAIHENEINPKKVSVEFSAEESNNRSSDNPQETGASSRPKPPAEIPPIKKEIAAHFNTHDESGRLFNVFKQYYTCLNESCGGTVRVTMKDGVCSLWNYDEWEEFAFVDIFEGDLRFAVDPRYTSDLSALDFCEVSRLLASRRNLVSIQVDDLNKTMLNALTKAFNEVGHAVS